MFDKILIALDTEEPCDRIFEKALALAQATTSQLVLLGVLTPSEEGTLPLLSYPDMTGYPLTAIDAVWDVYQDRYEAYKAKALVRLTRYQEQAIAAGIQTELHQKNGEPGRVICEVATAENAGLIMVGSHGRKGLNELLMGSVSNYVMHHAPCSVLIVHGKNITQPNNPAEPALSTAS